jgi:hypothetical protein
MGPSPFDCLSLLLIQEESRRLQLQSQMLQQRATEMSMRMSSSGGGNRPQHEAANFSSGRLQPTAAAAVVPLSQVSDLSAVMAAHNDQGGSMQYTTEHGYHEEPPSQANSVLEAEAYMQADDSLVPPDGMMPRHPPGDVTPSSVTSSRAGLHWNIPSRGSIPASPGNQGSRGDPRCAELLCAQRSRLEMSIIAILSAIKQRCQVCGTLPTSLRKRLTNGMLHT